MAVISSFNELKSNFSNKDFLDEPVGDEAPSELERERAQGGPAGAQEEHRLLADRIVLGAEPEPVPELPVPTPVNIYVNLGFLTRRFWTVSGRFSGSWCRFPESWGQDGENGEKMGKKRGKMGEKWPKKSGGKLT